MLSTFLIALREGLEASLIVGILVAYIVKTDRKNLLGAIWTGVSVALGASFALGGFLSFTSAELSDRGEQFFAGTTSFLAVGLVTWMVFWMKRAAGTLRDELHGKVENALTAGPVALSAAAFFAVAREGLETSLFVYTNFRTVNETPGSTAGLILGLAASVTLGYLIYKRSIKLNLSKFFTITGVALIVVAAGVLSYGIHEYQELGWLPGEDSFAWDISSWMSKESVAGTLLGGTVGFDVNTSWVQLILWATYLGLVLRLYLKPAVQKVLVK
ncbi:MAG: iron transporter [Actinobacteria bacterium]|nr:iron transporter [Actinomycetota bacterium]